MEKWLQAFSFLLFGLAGGMLYAHLYDFEVVGPEKHYQLEREIYNRSVDGGYGEFPAFHEWLGQEEQRQEKAHAYLHSLIDKLGEEAAETFDWGYYSPDPSRPMSAEQWQAAYGN